MRTHVEGAAPPGKEVSPIAKPIPLRYTKMTINIDRKLRQAFKAAVSLEGKEMSEVVLQFIKSYVKAHMPAALPKKAGRQ